MFQVLMIHFPSLLNRNMVLRIGCTLGILRSVFTPQLHQRVHWRYRGDDYNDVAFTHDPEVQLGPRIWSFVNFVQPVIGVDEHVTSLIPNSWFMMVFCQGGDEGPVEQLLDYDHERQSVISYNPLRQRRVM